MPSWQRIYFQLDVSRGEGYYFHVDLAIIDLVLSEVVEREVISGSFEFWRLHRRSSTVPGKEGHHLSLYFFAQKEVAERLCGTFRGADYPLLEDLRKEGILSPRVQENVSDQAVVWVQEHWTTEQFSSVEDDLTYSSGDWSPITKAVWYLFARRASQSLIEIVSALRDQRFNLSRAAVHSLAIKDQVLLYYQIDQALREMWLSDGGSAFIHQLHALYGYPEFRL